MLKFKMHITLLCCSRQLPYFCMFPSLSNKCVCAGVHSLLTHWPKQRPCILAGRLITQFYDLKKSCCNNYSSAQDDRFNSHPIITTDAMCIVIQHKTHRTYEEVHAVNETKKLIDISYMLL